MPSQTGAVNRRKAQAPAPEAVLQKREDAAEYDSRPEYF